MTSIAAYLRHTVEIFRMAPTGAPLATDGEDRGHPARTRTSVGTFAASVQPRSARERASASGRDVNIGTHRIYLEASALAVPVDSDMEIDLATPASLAGTYRILGVADAAGWGHHAEVDAELVRP